MSNRVCLGKISQSHGIKGLVKLFHFGENPELLEGELFTAEEGAETLKISLKNKLGKFILAEVEGCDNRDKADAIKGTELWVSRETLPALAEDAFYIDDLIGMEAVDENSTLVGSIIAVENYGAGDLLEIKPASGASFLLPFNDDTVVDIGKTVTIKNFQPFQDMA